jgi:hypothetical protein
MKPVRAAALVLVAGTLGLANATLSGHSTPVTRGAVDTLIFGAMSAPSKVSYTGIEQSLRIGTGAGASTVYRVEHRAPDLTLRVYTAPADLIGDSVVLKGDLSYAIDAKRHRVVETRDDAVDARAALLADDALLHKNYRITVKGSESFDGRPTVDVVVLSKYTDRLVMLLRIDQVTKIVLDKQEFTPDGALVSELRFEEIHYAPSIPTADFVVPSQYAEVQGPSFGQAFGTPDRAIRDAGFAAREPRTLPGGFSPIEGDLDNMQGVRTVHLLYFDGVHTVSLFENVQASTLEAAGLHPRPVRVEGHDGEYAEDGTAALLSWSDGSLYYTLVGEVGLVDLPHLAAFITP